MNSKDIYSKFNELNNDNTLICTQKELEEFMMYGLIFKTGDKYLNRNNQELTLNLLKVKELKFDIDFTSLITKCNELAKTNNIKRIYCMSNTSYNKYKKQRFNSTNKWCRLL